jgi:hypothetical protein
MARLTLVLCCVLVAVAGAVDFSGDDTKVRVLCVCLCARGRGNDMTRNRGPVVAFLGRKLSDNLARVPGIKNGAACVT